MILPGSAIGWEKVFQIWSEGIISSYDFIPARKLIDSFSRMPLYTHSYVYLEERKILGLVGIYGDELTFGAFGDLSDFFVSGPFIREKYKKRYMEIGQKLISHCQKQFKELYADVFMADKRAETLFQSCNFKVISQTTDPRFGKRYPQNRMHWSARAL